MRKHINLLARGIDYTKKEVFFARFRKITLIFGLLFAVSITVLFILTEKSKSDYQNLLALKQEYISDSLGRKDRELKIAYINKKASFVKSAIENDMNMLPYFKIIETNLFPTVDATAGASINAIAFNGARNIKLTLTAKSEAEFNSILRALEDAAFLDHFEQLTLEQTSISNTMQTNYQLIINGVFRKITETPAL